MESLVENFPWIGLWKSLWRGGVMAAIEGRRANIHPAKARAPLHPLLRRFPKISINLSLASRATYPSDAAPNAAESAMNVQQLAMAIGKRDRPQTLMLLLNGQRTDFEYVL